MYKLIIAQPGTMHQIVSNDEEYLCSLLGNKTDEQKQADAAFILNACNSHAALVDAMNDIVGAFAKARTMRAPAGHYDEDIYYNGIDLHAQIENAREALRMAQG